jgi:hypothetical protein
MHLALYHRRPEGPAWDRTRFRAGDRGDRAIESTAIVRTVEAVADCAGLRPSTVPTPRCHVGFRGRRQAACFRHGRHITVQQRGGHARWIDMLARHTPKRIALVVIAGLAVLAAFCMHGWSSNRARRGEPAPSS